MPTSKPSNPFYLALCIVGTAFAITACAYGVLIVLKQDPRRAIESPVAQFLDERGLWLLFGELMLLAVLAFAAMGTEAYWERPPSKPPS